MDQVTLFSVPMFISAAIGLAAGIIIWSRPRVSGSRYLALAMLAGAWWALSAALQAASINTAAEVLWNELEYFGNTTICVFFFLFAVHYGDEPARVSPLSVAALFLVPLITTVLVFLHASTPLVWASLGRDPDSGIVVFERGPWFWVEIAYSYSLLAYAVVRLGRKMITPATYYRRHIILLLCAVLLPLAGNLISLFRVSPIPGFDPTSLGFILSGAVLWWGIARVSFLDLVPVARDVIIDTMPDPVLVTDVHDRIVDLNAEMRRIIARPDAELFGMPLSEALSAHPGLVPALTSSADHAKRVDLLIGTERRAFDVRFTSIAGRGGGGFGRMYILRDVTEQVRAEEQLRQYTADLEAQNSELDAFAHTVAHDLKTPLAALSAYPSLLLDDIDDLDEELRVEGLTAIYSGASRMEEIIRGILALAGVRRMQDVPMEPVDTSGIINDLLRDFDRLITSSQVAVVRSTVWPVVLGYAPWIREVWMNYLSNALKYGVLQKDGSQSRIELGWEPCGESGPAGHIRFFVRDHGPGLTPAQQKQLFIAFTRLEHDRSDGHGLGLSIVQRIMTRLGGTSGVHSTPGEGSTFWFTLPQVEAPI